jgi:hypothetical protein
MGNDEVMEFILSQEHLPHDMAKVLYDNLWYLYESDECPQPSLTQTESYNHKDSE